MKKMLYFSLLVLFVLGEFSSAAQDPEFRRAVDKINSILKEHPYKDNFQEITIFYTVDVTPGNDLVVKMEYGPLITICKAGLAGLNRVPGENAAMIESTYLCWYCNPEHTDCVSNETHYASGEKDVHTTNNISIMFESDGKVNRELKKEFDKIFDSISERK